jgi:uncharacterized protein YqeY
MTTIAQKIRDDLKGAMKARDRDRSGALRMLGAALKNAEIEAGRPLNEDEEVVVLRRQLKQREESADTFRKAGREEQAGKEEAEAGIVREYLPEPMSRQEMEAVVERAIRETGAGSMREMGAVMGRATAISEGRAEGRELAAMVRGRLQGKASG